MCAALLALCCGAFTSCDIIGDGNPDFKYSKEYEVLLGAWTNTSTLEGEPYTLEFTFYKNGKVNVVEIFEGDVTNIDVFYTIQGDLSKGAAVRIYGGEIGEWIFTVLVNGDEAIFTKKGEEFVFTRK